MVVLSLTWGPVPTSYSRDSVVAYHGLEDRYLHHDSDGTLDPVLGPGLHALERVLQSQGFSLRPFVAKPETLVERKREAIAWFRLLQIAAGLTYNDEVRIATILRSYLGHPYDVGYGRRYHLETLVNRDFLTVEDQAISAARQAYHSVRTMSMRTANPGTRKVKCIPVHGQLELAVPTLGLTFRSGEEKVVTDRQASLLANNPNFQEIDGGCIKEK